MSMTPEEQRIAIAEACGWTRVDDLRCKWKAPDGRTHENWSGALSCPDYLGDLNAMHEAERTLNKFQCHDYNGRLSDTVTEPPNTATQCLRWTWGATAAQRAEAFLRTINAWKD